jgi:hypothetical protein
VGAYLDSTERLELLTPKVGALLIVPTEEQSSAYRNCELANADLVADMPRLHQHAVKRKIE